jgi:hypothetical protein
MADALVAARVDTTGWSTGAGLVEDLDDLAAGFTSGSWVDPTIGGIATALDTLAVCVDPLGSLVAWGVAWLMDHVKPLSDALDWLAGDPDQITAYAQTWRNVSGAANDAAAALRSAVDRDLHGWTGPTAEAYRAHAGTHLQALDGLTRAADLLALVVEGAGMLVATVRALVRDLIAQFVATLAVRLPEWAAAEGITLGLATPFVVTQVGALVGQWVAKIGRFLTGLTNSLRRLMPVLRRLEDLFARLSDLARSLRSGSLDSMGTRRAWRDPRDHPRPPSRPPDSTLPAGDPVYHAPHSTAIGYDSKTMTNFDKVRSEPGFHDVIVHGTDEGMFQPGRVDASGADFPANDTHPNHIADAIRDNPDYDGGPVRLVACHTGRINPDVGGVPAAQQVADALGVPVTAPTDAVGVSRHLGPDQVPRIRDGGKWVTFLPANG